MELKENKIFDAIVVGSGPGGAKTAYDLSNKGYSVLILDKEKLPRYKACGGGVPLKAAQNVGFDISPIVEQKINNVQLTFDSEDGVMLDTKEIGVMVMRDSFDAFLIDKAKKAGAALKTEQKVKAIKREEELYLVETNNHIFKCKILVGADGANSTVARKLHLRKYREMGIGIEREVFVTKEQLLEQADCATFDFGAVPYGYAWIFPKKDHLSIGVYSGDNKLKNLESYLERFVERQKVLRGSKIISNVWHPVPFGGLRENLHAKNALLVGDAAGLVDPFFGEGIAFALKSGAIAAEKIDDFLSNKTSSLNSYTETVIREISSDFKYARLIYKIVNISPRLSHKFFSKNKIVSLYFANTVKGEMKFKDLFFKTILTFPRWIFAY